jgi:pimeloyl-ACP methyl ester carboxylesterase
LPLATSAQTKSGQRRVDEDGFVSIGGIDQWVAIHGEDARSPLILYLHGGPAEAQSPFLKEFVPWEKDFIVVNWDQRGSGKTFGKNGTLTPDITLDRMAKDAIAVADYARQRLGKKKVILVGQSWGAILGLAVLQRRADLFYAFVGTGQPVNWVLSIEDRERWARAQATAAGDTVALKTLDEAVTLPATDDKRLAASNKWRMSASDFEYLKSVQGKFVGPSLSPAKGDAADWAAGAEFSGPKLWRVITSFDARKLSLDMPIPFFVIQGRDDHVASFDAAKSYVDSIRAPAKAFVPIDGGHFACFTDPDQFVGALRKYVLPLTKH